MNTVEHIFVDSLANKPSNHGAEIIYHVDSFEDSLNELRMGSAFKNATDSQFWNYLLDHFYGK